MGVQFLSEDWMATATETLNGHEGFNNAISNVEMSMQFVVTGGPDGDIDYHLAVENGNASMALGVLEGADVTVRNDYETAAAIARGDLNTQMAFMSGKLKVEGNMAKLMMHQNVINEFANAVSTLDTDF